MANKNRAYLETVVSYYENIFDVNSQGTDTIGNILARIKTQELQAKIGLIRASTKRNPQKVEELKKQLPAFTCAGVFKKRNDDSLLQPSNLMVIDIDKIPQELYEDLKQRICSDRHVLAAWKSPTGRGLKIMVPMIFGRSNETYKNRCIEVLNYFSKAYEIPFAAKVEEGEKWGLIFRVQIFQDPVTTQVTES
jgi:hypothetical protein